MPHKIHRDRQLPFSNAKVLLPQPTLIHRETLFGSSGHASQAIGLDMYLKYM